MHGVSGVRKRLHYLLHKVSIQQSQRYVARYYLFVQFIVYGSFFGYRITNLIVKRLNVIFRYNFIVKARFQVYLSEKLVYEGYYLGIKAPLGGGLRLIIRCVSRIPGNIYILTYSLNGNHTSCNKQGNESLLRYCLVCL